ncbi:hypothetical protein ADEAN_000815100 [Angomonas deanei]|uniref:Uncharacterized protein n=1 Tax=Angomonas deanei TaxID=59799 RepID=A0A7G2CMI0_9TRYP|nr:hypothetical protein ADEAN_000815100 [Angomonas deanei]
MSKPNSPFINIDSTFLDSTLHDSIEVEESTPETTTKEDDSIVAQNVLETLQKKDRQIAALTSQLNFSLEEKNELLLKMNVLREKNKALEEQVSMFVRNVNDLTIILDSERVAFKRKLQDAIQHNHTVTNTEKEVFTLKEELSEAQQEMGTKTVRSRKLQERGGTVAESE